MTQCMFLSVILFIKTKGQKSLKIPKGKSESVYRRRADNTMVKRKRKNYKQRSTKHTHETKDREHEPH